MAKYIATDEDANPTNNTYITEAGTYVFKTTSVIHKVSQTNGTDLFEATFATKDGATAQKPIQKLGLAVLNIMPIMCYLKKAAHLNKLKLQ
jgi:hypothetical protein